MLEIYDFRYIVKKIKVDFLSELNLIIQQNDNKIVRLFIEIKFNYLFYGIKISSKKKNY